MVGLLGDRMEGGLEWKWKQLDLWLRSLWLRIAYTKAGAWGEGLGLYEKCCSDSHNRDEKLSFVVCASMRGKKK